MGSLSSPLEGVETSSQLSFDAWSALTTQHAIEHKAKDFQFKMNDSASLFRIFAGLQAQMDLHLHMRICWNLTRRKEVQNTRGEDKHGLEGRFQTPPITYHPSHAKITTANKPKTKLIRATSKWFSYRDEMLPEP